MKLKPIEIALATLVLLAGCYTLLGEADLAWRGKFKPADHYMSGFAAHGLRFSFTFNYLLPELLQKLIYYFFLVWIAVGLPNRYAQQKKWRQLIFSILAGCLVTWLSLLLTGYLAKPFYHSRIVHGMYRHLGHVGMVFFIGAAYLLFKNVAIALIKRKVTNGTLPRYQVVIIESCIAAAIWLLLMGICIFIKPGDVIGLFITLVVPCFFTTYLLNLHWLIPQYFIAKNLTPFWLWQLGVTFTLNFFLTGIYLANVAGLRPFSFLILLFIWLTQLVLIIPVAFVVHRRKVHINILKVDLNTSAATLQSLRAQINPHFLFNALNSLYSMALTEQAEKTGEGIHRLGDMMRFMLHENNQESIALGSEITYLQNYISMQNIRIAASPNINITAHISPNNLNYNIAPMLLVPFVENAYKHGISFKEPSWIHISLEIQDGQLQFDVRNSIHHNRKNDTEHHSSGIGLENVRQRLVLLYPNRHSLVIRKTEAEFSVYLNLQLS